MTHKNVLLALAAVLAASLVACGRVPSTLTFGTSVTPTEAPAAVATELATELSPTAAPTEPAAAQAALPPGNPAPFPKINLLHMVDTSNGWAADLEGELYRTADGGSSWYLVPTPPDVQFNPNGSAFLDAAHAWLSFYDPGGFPALLRTADGGLTWTPLTGIGLEQAGGEAGFRFSSPDEGVAEVAGVGAGNLYIQELETHDGGASFEVVPLVGPTNEQGLPPGTLHLCNVCTDAFHYDPSRAIIVEGDMGTMESRGKVHVKQTTDLGRTWTEKILPLPDGYEEALVGGLPIVFEGQERHGWLPVRLMKYNADGSPAFDVTAIYVTPDGGQTWNLTPTVLPNVNSGTIQFPDALDAVALCGGNICVTHDEAQTWETITPNVDFSSTDTRYVLSMQFVTPLTGWVILANGDAYELYRTDDGGGTWNLLNQ
jgi:photosystem II stability/assembly factor-like uncharacterized protein